MDITSDSSHLLFFFTCLSADIPDTNIISTTSNTSTKITLSGIHTITTYLVSPVFSFLFVSSRQLPHNLARVKFVRATKWGWEKALTRIEKKRSVIKALGKNKCERKVKERKFTRARDFLILFFSNCRVVTLHKFLH